ncbi:hypothetical protein FHS31_001989 [Sphingomonas vulcanisoli]|uniref:DUF541 domain-containing protein n=1 Tax=Sphingomonas vulcanisoli TaxID=1658060 RepID=A0ABX0TS98_9SPHN|nr:SIMPL domain-containing protein [Sphingomonas vulcanisoli]NIJ08372.1 hypothetical protein [Sphingomonas vulcanisoli]
MRLLPLALLTALATPAFAADPPPVNSGATRLELDATGEVTRTPDVVQITAGVVTQSANAARALADNAERMTATIAALRRAGVAPSDLQTSAIRLQPQYRYTDGQPPAIIAYQATNQVAVRLHDVAGSGKVLDALVAAGANQIDGPNLGIDKPEAALDEARVQALTTARARAELYAKAAGLHVRRIAQISESGSDAPVIRPMAMMAMAKRADTPIEAGESKLSVTLHVTFELD